VDAGITGKVVSVEGENVSDPIHGHRCDEPCIVGLLPRHAVCHNEPAPFRIDIVSVRESKNETQREQQLCRLGQGSTRVRYSGPAWKQPRAR